MSAGYFAMSFSGGGCCMKKSEGKNERMKNRVHFVHGLPPNAPVSSTGDSFVIFFQTLFFHVPGNRVHLLQISRFIFFLPWLIEKIHRRRSEKTRIRVYGQLHRRGVGRKRANKFYALKIRQWKADRLIASSKPTNQLARSRIAVVEAAVLSPNPPFQPPLCSSFASNLEPRTESNRVESNRCETSKAERSGTERNGIES